MPINIGSLAKLLPTTGAALEADIAGLLTSTTPEGWLAKGALAALGGLGATNIVKSLTKSKTPHRRSRSRSPRSRSRKSRRSRMVRHSHIKHGMRIGSRKWMAHIRRMRKKH